MGVLEGLWMNGQDPCNESIELHDLLQYVSYDAHKPKVQTVESPPPGWPRPGAML